MMKLQEKIHGTEGKGGERALRVVSGVLLSLAVLFWVVPFSLAQGVGFPPFDTESSPAGGLRVPPFDGPFYKAPVFMGSVGLAAFGAVGTVSQSYDEAVGVWKRNEEGDGFDFLQSGGFNYGFGASVDGIGEAYNTISSVPFGFPGDRLFHSTTLMGAGNTDPGKTLAAADRFSFASCCPQSGIVGAAGFNTQLIEGKAASRVRFETAASLFEAGYLGSGLGTVGLGAGFEAGSPGGNASYNGSIAVEGDFRVSYSVSSGPSGRCLLGW